MKAAKRRHVYATNQSQRDCFTPTMKFIKGAFGIAYSAEKNSCTFSLLLVLDKCANQHGIYEIRSCGFLTYCSETFLKAINHFLCHHALVSLICHCLVIKHIVL